MFSYLSVPAPKRLIQAHPANTCACDPVCFRLGFDLHKLTLTMAVEVQSTATLSRLFEANGFAKLSVRKARKRRSSTESRRRQEPISVHP